MKKIILLALATLIMVGCNDKRVKYKTTEAYVIVEIDSCEKELIKQLKKK